MIYKILGEIDVDKLTSELSGFIVPSKGQQMLQGIKGQEDDSYGTGSYTQYKEAESDFIYPIVKDADYLYSLLQQYDMFRTRIMSMSNKHYSWHADGTPRIHIPLISDTETNFMVVEDTVIRMEPGLVYWVDTTRKHTYVNTDTTYRVHIVGCVN